MCVSAVLETDRQRIADHLGLSRLVAADERSAQKDESARYRIEANSMAPVIRSSACGRLVVESMRFKSYVIKRDNLTGDMFADSMLGATHGIIVMRMFSEWVSTYRLLQLRVLPEQEVNCAFNRFAPAYGKSPGPQSSQERLILANFAPQCDSYLLVPVLFAPPTQGHDETIASDFVIVSDEPPEEVAALGGRLAPVGLTLEGAMSWLATLENDDADIVDFTDVLEDIAPETFGVALYKSA